MSGKPDLPDAIRKQLDRIGQISSLLYLVITPVAAVVAFARSDRWGILPFAVWIVILTLAYSYLTARSQVTPDQPMLRQSRVTYVYLACGIATGLYMLVTPVWSSLTSLLPAPFCGTSSSYALPLDVSRITQAAEVCAAVPRKLVQGQSDPLLPHYLSANSELVERIRSFPAADVSEVFLLIPAPGGAGKSYVANWMQSELGEQLYSIDVARTRSPEGLVLFPPFERPRPLHDLKFRDAATGKDIVLNQLSGPAVDEATLERILLPADTRKLVLIDSLDEVHPDYSAQILGVVANALRRKQLRAAIIFSRPEGFADFLRPGKNDGARGLTVELRALRMPCYQYGNGTLDAQAIQDRVANWRARYKRTDLPDLEERVMKLLQAKPWLQETFQNLGWSREIIENLAKIRNSSEWSDKKWREVLMATMLRRAYDAHRRPTDESVVYLHLLQEVAAQYWMDAVRTPGGYFEVSFTDSPVAVMRDGKQIGAVEPYRVLERSGIVWIDPLDNNLRRFRYDPVWVHAHLVELWNERRVPNYRYGSSAWYLGWIRTVDWTSRICWFLFVTGATTLLLYRASKQRRQAFRLTTGVRARRVPL